MTFRRSLAAALPFAAAALLISAGFAAGKFLPDEESFKITSLDAAQGGAQKTRFRVTGEEDPARVIVENAKLGVGVTSPTELLEVNGAVKIGGAAGTADGTIRWTGTDFEGRKGGEWVSLTGPGGGWKLLETKTADNSATVDFTSGIDATYRSYAVVISYMRPQTNSTHLYMRTSSDGGSSFDSGSSNYRYRTHATSDNGGGHALASSGATFMAVSGSEIGNLSSDGYCGEVRLFDPSQTTSYKQVTSLFHYTQLQNPSRTTIGHGGGMRQSTAAVNAIRFFMSSGDIVSGVFELYGLK
jgi:hypothetical protein